MSLLIPDRLRLPRDDATVTKSIEDGDGHKFNTYFLKFVRNLLHMYIDIAKGFRATKVRFDVIMNEDGEYFTPPRESASAQLTPEEGELKIWRDPDDSKTYLIYNDINEGVRKVEMT